MNTDVCRFGKGGGGCMGGEGEMIISIDVTFFLNIVGLHWFEYF